MQRSRKSLICSEPIDYSPYLPVGPFSNRHELPGKRGESSVEIHVVDNNVEKAIRVLKRKLQQEGLFREMKQRKFYEKPSVKRKRKEKEAQRRLRKKMRLMRKD